MTFYSELDSKKTYILPPGQYYIGDLGYIVGDYIEIYSSGYYKSDESIFIIGETYEKTGVFTGSDRKNYMVDNGIIGIASANLINDPDTTGGHMYTFDNEVAVRINSGIFRFNSYFNDNTYFELVITTVSRDERDSE